MPSLTRHPQLSAISLDTTYTVREIFMGRSNVATFNKQGTIVKNPKPEDTAEVAILLEELTNGEDPFCAGRELAFNAERFAELQETTDELTAHHTSGVELAGVN